jgi:hypothetical protein
MDSLCHYNWDMGDSEAKRALFSVGVLDNLSEPGDDRQKQESGELP